MVLVCVPLPGKQIVKSAEHVSDVDADYKPPLLPLPLNCSIVVPPELSLT